MHDVTGTSCIAGPCREGKYFVPVPTLASSGFVCPCAVLTPFAENNRRTVPFIFCGNLPPLIGPVTPHLGTLGSRKAENDPLLVIGLDKPTPPNEKGMDQN